MIDVTDKYRNLHQFLSDFIYIYFKKDGRDKHARSLKIFKNNNNEIVLMPFNVNVGIVRGVSLRYKDMDFIKVEEKEYKRVTNKLAEVNLDKLRSDFSVNTSTIFNEDLKDTIRMYRELIK